jgi:hypothetical protein
VKDTVGKIALDLQNSGSGFINPQEIQQATAQEYLDNLMWCVEHALKKIDCSTLDGHDICKDRLAFEGDFYIACLIKKEKLLQNVLRNYFIPTQSCPTPHFDQTVYKYDSKKEHIEYLWTVPDQETCLILAENKNIVVPEEQQLLKYVLDYFDGTLLKLAKKLNGETQFAGSLLDK